MEADSTSSLPSCVEFRSPACGRGLDHAFQAVLESDARRKSFRIGIINPDEIRDYKLYFNSEDLVWLVADVGGLELTHYG